MSDKSQTLTLESITSEFTVAGGTWIIKSGEKLQIAIEFHPQREQIYYHGEAIFTHDYGKDTIHLLGVGASADFVCSEVVDFGRLKVGTKRTMQFEIQNHGVLPTNFEMDFVQDGLMYKFVGVEPYEAHGVLNSGTTMKFEIECVCNTQNPTPAQISIRWKRIPLGNTEQSKVTLITEAGYPTFDLHQAEFDFKTTFIDVNKSLPCVMTNNGNASCNW
jgi:hypothetical protein